MSKSAYISTIPDSIIFSLKYSDNSGEKLKVSLSEKKKDVVIKDGNDTCLIPVEDIDWLRDVLNDINQVIKMEKDTQK